MGSADTSSLLGSTCDFLGRPLRFGWSLVTSAGSSSLSLEVAGCFPPSMAFSELLDPVGFFEDFADSIGRVSGFSALLPGLRPRFEVVTGSTSTLSPPGNTFSVSTSSSAGPSAALFVVLRFLEGFVGFVSVGISSMATLSNSSPSPSLKSPARLRDDLNALLLLSGTAVSGAAIESIRVWPFEDLKQATRYLFSSLLTSDSLPHQLYLTKPGPFCHQHQSPAEGLSCLQIWAQQQHPQQWSCCAVVCLDTPSLRHHGRQVRRLFSSSMDVA